MPKATSSMPDLTSYEIFDGRFRLLSLLGAGSYGKVYKALDKRPKSSENSRHYAIKCLIKPENGSKEHEMQRRELRLQKKLSQHPNIVTFLGEFEENGYVFAVMELCDGGDLFSAIVDRGIFEGNDALIKSCYDKILDAVYYCHRQGVYHRDLKPENILCSMDGSDIRLADFGLSTNRRVCRDFGCGSNAYMSPECIGKETDNVIYSALHNDIWSLGIILVNLITQHNPWSYAHSSDPCFDAFLSESTLRIALPISESVDRILQRALNLNPIGRISIPLLRKAILAVDTFYNPDWDVESPPIDLSPELPSIRVEVDVQVMIDLPSQESQPRAGPLELSPASSGSDELCRRGPKSVATPSVGDVFVQVSHSSESDSRYKDDDSMSDFEPEADLLVTPPHVPVELSTEVPDIRHDSSHRTSDGRTVRRRPNFSVAPRSFGKDEPKFSMPIHRRVKDSVSETSPSLTYSVSTIHVHED